MRKWVANRGLPEGPGAAIQINRNLYDPNVTGRYVRPDMYLRDEGVIIDGTIGAPKAINSRQMQGYINYVGRDHFIIEVAPVRLPRVIYARRSGD